MYKRHRRLLVYLRTTFTEWRLCADGGGAVVCTACLIPEGMFGFSIELAKAGEHHGCSDCFRDSGNVVHAQGAFHEIYDTPS